MSMGEDSPSDYVIVEPQSPSDVKVEIIENVEEDVAEDVSFARDCFVCFRHFTDHNLFFIHLTVHKVDHTIWKAKNHKRSTMLKKELGGVDCIGCTFWYKAEECFVGMCGNRYVCTFCYDATRLDHCRRYGVRKDGTFPYENFLLSDYMKQESNSSWKPAQMRLNKEEKIARINEIQKELRRSPQIRIESLLAKWAITHDDFERFRSDKQTGSAKRSRKSNCEKRGPKAWTEKPGEVDTLVCPVTKIPLVTIAKIRGVLKDQKTLPTGSEPEVLSELLRKWEVEMADYRTYKAMIEIKPKPENTHFVQIPDNRKQTGSKCHPIYRPIQANPAIKPKTIAKSLLNSKNVYKVATVKTNGNSKNSIPPNAVLMPNSTGNGPETGNFDISKLAPFLMTSGPTTSEAANIKRMHDWLSGNEIKTGNGITGIVKNGKPEVKPDVNRKRSDENRVKRLKKSENKCVNCGTNTATLWRRIKSPEEIEAKRPYVKAQTNRLEYTGKLACNSCALYWSLHGKHRQTSDIQNDQPRKRNRKRTYERVENSEIPKNPIPAGNSIFPNSQLNPELEKTLLQLWHLQSQNLQKQAEMEQNTFPFLQQFNTQSDSSILRRALDEGEHDEPASIGSAESSESQNSAPKIAKTEFVEEDEILDLGPSSDSGPDSGPIDYSMSTSDVDTASEADNLKINKNTNLESFQLFCHICLKIISPGLNKGRKPGRNSKKGAEIGVAQCFMCPRAIYCKTCIYSINHLKLHSGRQIDIPINKTD